MEKVGTGAVVQQLQMLWDAGALGSVDDGALLEQFRMRGATAERAFAALVERHGPMVLRVCRDVLRDPHDAKDAAQATFLILARKASSISAKRPWRAGFFGTARRVASLARRDAARRANGTNGNGRRWSRTVGRKMRRATSKIGIGPNFMKSWRVCPAYTGQRSSYVTSRA